jgi:hypothetical protein
MSQKPLKNRRVTRTKKISVTPKLKTHIAIVLDRSGSMSSIWNETVSGFNNQVRTIRESAKDQDVRVSLVTFSDSARFEFFDQSVESLKELNSFSGIFPCGNTAMYDAVGETIERLNKLEDIGDPNTSVLMIIISDGEENQSRHFTSRTLAPLVDAMTKTKRWTFTYMGANQDLTKISEKLNIPYQNTMLFRSTQAGANLGWAQNNMATATYMASRSMGQTQASSFYQGVTNPQITTTITTSKTDEETLKKSGT